MQSVSNNAVVPTAGRLLQLGDLWGGAAAAAVLLPQAMAFGVTLYAIAALDPAWGALAGLFGAAALSIASGAVGGTCGMISAPTGPTLVLLSSALTALLATGLDGPAAVTMLALVIALGGVMQFLIGASGGGRLIKYIPYPVVSGFMTGSAVLMVLSQLEPLRGAGVNDAWYDWRWLPAAAAIATVAGSRLIPRVWPWLPGPIGGLVLGCLTFHGLAWIHGGSVPAGWMIGDLPRFGEQSLGLSLAVFDNVPWQLVIPAAGALAVLASLDTLLTAVIADVATTTRHDSRRELMGQGAGQVLSAVFGGIAGAGTTAGTVVAINAGGGRRVALACGALFVVLIVAAGDIGRILPIGALSGVILAVAIGVADRDIVRWARQARTRQDAGVAILVSVITILYDLMIAVGVGVAIAILMFIVDQITAPVVHRRSTAAETRSIRARPPAERALLDEHGQRVVVYELRGNLFFGTADRLIDELGDDLEGPNWIILYMRRVTQIDLTAIRFLQQIASRLGEHGGTLMFCEVHHGAGFEGSVEETFRLATAAGNTPVPTFNGVDEALEYAENALLNSLAFRPTGSADEVALAANAICRYLAPAEVELLAGRLRQVEVAANEHLFVTGDHGDSLILVARGEIEIRAQTTAHHHKRLAVHGGGSFFGELALLTAGPRAADAVAAEDSVCWVLDRTVFDGLRESEPRLAIGLLTAMCDTLVTNQRWSTLEIKRLAEW